jgi:hypothetical protein
MDEGHCSAVLEERFQVEELGEGARRWSGATRLGRYI